MTIIKTNIKRNETTRGKTMPEVIYERLINRIRAYHPSDDLKMVEEAYRLAKEAHENQFRKSGEPYIIHPLEVAYILADLELDMESITAGILHDVVEDTDYTIEDIKRFRPRIIARCFLPWHKISVWS
jgi:guanosine-3',5'-bis(diphosphate) 3'-pyrophosphohydrolase